MVHKPSYQVEFLSWHFQFLANFLNCVCEKGVTVPVCLMHLGVCVYVLQHTLQETNLSINTKLGYKRIEEHAS